MLSSNRIIAAEELGTVERFSIGVLPVGHSKPVRGRANGAGGDDVDPLKHSFEQGFKQGVEQTTRRMAEARAQEEHALGMGLNQRVDSLALALEAEFAAFEEHAAARLVDLAVEIARQVVRGTLAVQADAVVPIVSEALATILPRDCAARLYLNPADAELVRRSLAGVLTRRAIEVCPDPEVSIGGCRLVGDHAEVDATVQARWQRAVAAIGRPQAGAPGSA